MDTPQPDARSKPGATPLWAIVPALDLVEMTIQTCEDLLNQSVPVRVLLVDQGSSEASNDAFRRLAEACHPNVLLWSFNPALPSLSACWNRALAFVWSLGGTEALVVNSDVRLHRDTAAILQKVRRQRDALFVTALGVGAAEFDPERRYDVALDDGWAGYDKGGPDFSCFLITQAGHKTYPFDEGFVPAFMEDCDAHRRYLLGGDGDRIFSVNLPFHHIGGGSRTINQSDEARQRFERQAQIGRQHYQRKWGGPPNQERFVTPFSGPAFDGVTNPELQARQQAGVPVLEGTPAVSAIQQKAIDAVRDQLERELFRPDPAVGDARELTGIEAAAALNEAFGKKAQEIRDRAMPREEEQPRDDA